MTRYLQHNTNPTTRTKTLGNIKNTLTNLTRNIKPKLTRKF